MSADIILTGNVGKVTAYQDAVRISVACVRGKNDETGWLDCWLSKSFADVVKVGDFVKIYGYLRYSEYKKDDENRRSFSVNAVDCVKFDRKPKGDQE